MGSIKADDKRLLKDLGNYWEPVEVYDANDKLLGLFVPGNLERCKEKYAKLEAMIDWEEIRRRSDNSRPRIPNAQVLAGFKALEREMQRRASTGEQPLTKEEARALMRAVCLPPSVQSLGAAESV
jgi:hypothetical protein